MNRRITGQTFKYGNLKKMGDQKLLNRINALFTGLIVSIKMN